MVHRTMGDELGGRKALIPEALFLAMGCPPERAYEKSHHVSDQSYEDIRQLVAEDIVCIGWNKWVVTEEMLEETKK